MKRRGAYYREVAFIRPDLDSLIPLLFFGGGIITLCNHSFLETLFVGIDVSKNSNQACFLDFCGNKLKNFSFPNNLDGAKVIETTILSFVSSRSFSHVIIVLESTGIFSHHIANFLSSSENLIACDSMVYLVNPISTSNYGKVLLAVDKNDPADAFFLADFARSGHTIALSPFRGSQRLALQRLTRHRKHVVELQVREKTYLLNNLFLKFSDYNNSQHGNKCFSCLFSETSSKILARFASPEQIAACKTDKLVELIVKYSKNKFKDPLLVAQTLQKAARSSYRLDKASYEPINIALASSFNLISCYEKEIAALDKAIARLIIGLDNQNQIKSLLTIPGIGTVFASGIMAEIGDIHVFRNDDALAKYVGLVWKKHQSGNFCADDTRLSKCGNSYLRYYIIEAAGSVARFCDEYKNFYDKKFSEVTVHQHPRALVLTARKLVRLIYGLMSNNQLFEPRT